MVATRELKNSTQYDEGRWNVVHSWAYSGDVANVDFDVRGYQDLIIFVNAVTLSAADQRMIRCSVDNGATFLGDGNYMQIDVDGIEGTSGFTGFALHGTTSALARGGTLRMSGIDLPTPRKLVERLTRYSSAQLLFAGPAQAITHLRLCAQTAGNITGGSVQIIGRK